MAIAPSMTPLSVRFDSHVELTIHGAFLAAAGLLQCDPLARVHVVTVRTRTSAAAATRVSDSGDDDEGEGDMTLPPPSSSSLRTTTAISAREVGHTRQRLCTAHPVYKETMRFDVRGNSSLTALVGTLSQQQQQQQATMTTASLQQAECIEDYVVITFEDEDGQMCYGQAYCPFSPHCSSAALTPVRVALQPRNAHDVHDPLYKRDVAALTRLQRDHFGYVTVTWLVTVLPHGGALVRSSSSNSNNNNNKNNNNTDDNNNNTATVADGGQDAMTAPSLPVGLTVKATWLAPATLRQAGVQFTTSLALDKTDSSSGGSSSNNTMTAVTTAAAAAAAATAERFSFTPQRPLCLTIRRASAASALARAVVYCTLHNLTQPACSRDVAVPLPLPSLTSPHAYDRDVHWLAAVRTATGEDLGMLLTTTRLSRRALDAELPPCPDDQEATAGAGGMRCAHVNDPLHQEQYTHAARPLPPSSPPPPSSTPQCPAGPYRPLQWSSATHITRATERRWRHSCVVDAQPREEHVRHLFDVLMRRCATLDASVAQLAAVFAGDAVYAPHGGGARPPSSLSQEAQQQQQQPSPSLAASLLYSGGGELGIAGSAADGQRVLRELMVACAFHACDMSVQRAARFCFCALRSDVEDAVGVDEVHFIFEHCLLAGTVDMPADELRRYVRDLVGDVRVVSFADYTRYIVHNYALWSLFGVPLTVDMAASSAQRRHLYYRGDATATQTTTAAAANTATPAAITSYNSNSRAAVMATADVAVTPQQLSDGNTDGVHRAREQHSPPYRAEAVAPPARSSSSSHCTHDDGSNGKARQTRPRRPGASIDDATLAATTGRDDKDGADDDDDGGSEWRTFVVRVASTQKAYSVTAHVRDTVYEAMTMVQDSIGIAAARQEWCGNDGTVLSASARIGSTTLGLSSLPSLSSRGAAAAAVRRGRDGSRAASSLSQQRSGSASRHRSHSSGGGPQTTQQQQQQQDVWIREQDDTTLVHFSCIGRSAALQKHWQERIRTGEKVLRVRAAVQRRTLIPLSRCVLRLRRGGGGGGAATVLLHDRHPLSHYNLQPEDVIEVTQE